MSVCLVSKNANEVLFNDSVILPELTQMGVKLERWNVQDVDLTHIDLDNPTAALIQEIVMGDQQCVDRLYAFRTPNGKIDLVSLYPDMKGLDELLVKFKQVHDHAAPEIRLILGGAGVFNLYNDRGERFEILVKGGDFLFIPADIAHNFELTAAHTIRALRVFQDQDGWVPRPREI